MYTAHCNFVVMLGSEDVPIRVRSLMDVLMVQLQSTALAAAIVAMRVRSLMNVLMSVLINLIHIATRVMISVPALAAIV